MSDYDDPTYWEGVASEIRAERDRRVETQPSPGPLNFDLVFSDVGNGARFAELHRESYRYVADVGEWIRYDGKRWARATDGELLRAAKQVIDRMLAEASMMPYGDARAKALGWAAKCANEGRLKSMISLATSEQSIEVRAKDLDHDPWLLAVENGTLDLRTRELRAHEPGDLITKYVPIPYEPEADAPRWLQFVSSENSDRSRSGNSGRSKKRTSRNGRKA